MSWIKPNFLWMMYRSSWASKEGQELVLAITLKRSLFDFIFSLAVASSIGASDETSHEVCQEKVTNSQVRLQWDSDHCPLGSKLERRAVQLGLHGEMLKRYATEAVKIEDVSKFVREQREHLIKPFTELMVPEERIYKSFTI